MVFSSWTSMDALQEATAKLQGLTASLGCEWRLRSRYLVTFLASELSFNAAYIATHQKLTPNQTIPDQIEELQEVWQCLEERLLALQDTPAASRQAHPACRELTFQ